MPIKIVTLRAAIAAKCFLPSSWSGDRTRTVDYPPQDFKSCASANFAIQPAADLPGLPVADCKNCCRIVIALPKFRQAMKATGSMALRTLCHRGFHFFQARFGDEQGVLFPILGIE